MACSGLWGTESMRSGGVPAPPRTSTTSRIHEEGVFEVLWWQPWWEEACPLWAGLADPGEGELMCWEQHKYISPSRTIRKIS